MKIYYRGLILKKGFFGLVVSLSSMSQLSNASLPQGRNSNALNSCASSTYMKSRAHYKTKILGFTAF
jgi:hypothetical protein